MKWRQQHGVWTSGAYTIRLYHDPRTKVVLFDLYRWEQFIRSCVSAQSARAYAEEMEASHAAMEA